jgi:transcriptional regulator with XRE-family HTH domain
LGLSQQELGALCGVRFQQIQKYECAANRLYAVMLFKLARALDVEVGYFFSGLAADVSAEPKSWRDEPPLS